MKPMHGRLVALTQGALTFEGIVTAGETEQKVRGLIATFHINLSTIRIDASKLPESVDGAALEQTLQTLRAMYPNLIINLDDG